MASDGTKESDINLDIAKKLDEMMTFFGYSTLMTRENDESIGEKNASIRSEKVTDIHKRMEIMNSVENAVFISIHQNFYGGSSAWGCQVFYSDNNELSRVLAQCIQDNYVGLIQPDNKRAVKKSGSDIYLLYNAEKPAVMVECGFLSNENDLKNLKDDIYRQKTAFAVVCGINDYICKGNV